MGFSTSTGPHVVGSRSLAFTDDTTSPTEGTIQHIGRTDASIGPTDTEDTIVSCHIRRAFEDSVGGHGVGFLFGYQSPSNCYRVRLSSFDSGHDAGRITLEKIDGGGAIQLATNSLSRAPVPEYRLVEVQWSKVNDTTVTVTDSEDIVRGSVTATLQDPNFNPGGVGVEVIQDDQDWTSYVDRIFYDTKPV